MEKQILGTSGDDRVFGTEDGDRILGGGGNDVIRGAGGFDYLWGDGGDDVFVYFRSDLSGDSFDFVVSGGSGYDTLFLRGNRSTKFELNNLSDAGGVDSIETLAFGGKAKGIQLKAVVPIGLLDFMDGKSSNPGEVVISGSKLTGVEDVLVLRPHFFESAESDFSNLKFSYWESEDRIVIDARSQMGSLGLSVRGTKIDDRIIGDQWNNKVNGDRGNDTIIGAGGNDNLAGGPDRDLLRGGAGNDRLRGNSGEDHLKGGKGSDTIWGGSNRDTMDGGRGNDVLIGGSGDDVFIFSERFGKDVIRDFEIDVDTLLLDQAIWGGGLNQDQLLEQYAKVEDGAMVLDFGRHELRIENVSDASALVSDIGFL